MQFAHYSHKNKRGINMKKIFKKTKLSWKCSYCGYLNDLSTNTCEKCGSVRSGEEEEKEITTKLERTTTEIQDDESQDIIISTRGSRAVCIALGIVIVLVFIVAPIIYGINHKKAENNSNSYHKVSYNYSNKKNDDYFSSYHTNYNKNDSTQNSYNINNRNDSTQNVSYNINNRNDSTQNISCNVNNISEVKQNYIIYNPNNLNNQNNPNNPNIEVKNKNLYIGTSPNTKTKAYKYDSNQYLRRNNNNNQMNNENENNNNNYNFSVDEKNKNNYNNNYNEYNNNKENINYSSNINEQRQINYYRKGYTKRDRDYYSNKKMNNNNSNYDDSNKSYKHRQKALYCQYDSLDQCAASSERHSKENHS